MILTTIAPAAGVTGMRRRSLRSYSLGSILRSSTVGLTSKQQRLEARGDPCSYYHGPIGALSPLAGACGGRYESRGGLVDAA
ncbi:hypothetical protein Holit_02072 [Hollandina sp. SP2]